jgi:outer membrane receptor protein involved in Fe transport
MNKFLKTSLFLLSLPVYVLGQTAADKSIDSTKNLEEITVTATRNQTSNLLLPYAISTVDRKQMTDYQFRTTPESLVGTTGVFVQKTNHGGGSPFIRGLTGNQALFMVDGIRLNNATFRYGPNQYLNTIDAYTISKIEVASGTGSVQYGSDALGGVIQLFTNDIAFANKKSIHGLVVGKATTNNVEYTTRAEIQYQSKKIAFIGGLTLRNFGDLVGGDTTGTQKPSGYTEQAFNGKFKWKISNRSILTLAHQNLLQKNVPLYHRVKLENFAYYNFDPQQKQISYAKIDIDGNGKLVNKIAVIASYQQSLEKRKYQRNGNSNKFIERDKINTLGLTIDIASNISKTWKVNTGVEYYHDKVNSIKYQTTMATNTTLAQRGLYPNNANSANFSLYSLHHITIKSFEIEAGLRYNSVAINIPDTVTTTLKLGDVSVNPTSVVANIALLHRITKTQSIYGSFSTGYRTPNIDDMGTLGLVDFRYEIPAYDLQPEKTFNTEIGYKFYCKKISASAAFYYMHLSNLITRVQVAGQQVGGYNVYTKQNSQESFIRGFEANVNYQLTQNISLQANASYNYGQNLSAKEPMRRMPPFNGRSLVKYEKGKWQFSVENIFASKQNRLAQGDKDDNRIPVGGTPAFHVINYYTGYTHKNYGLQLSFNNLLNNDYRTHGSGINGLGKNVSIAMQVKF